jgi:hypothetical protein
MSFAGVLKAEAAWIADHNPLEILEKAQEAVRQTRFARIRKHKAPAVTDQEKAYVAALRQYVNCKLMLWRETKKDWGRRDFNFTHRVESEMLVWRNKMDTIEHCWGAAV